MAGRASIVGAAATHVGNVREHNEDAHCFDAELGLFVVCDGMGGHAAGEVASAIAIQTIRERWSDEETLEIADVWLERGTAIAKRQLMDWLRDGVLAAHQAIISEAERDPTKAGMGTTLVASMIIGSELVFAHAGDSRAYMVRDGIAMQLTEDHTLLQRLLAAGIDVDVSGDGARFGSMLTNALGIGHECKVSTFVVPLADGDRFMICSDGISEYVPEAEVGEVLVEQPSPALAAQKLIDLALERGGADNATAVVIRVLEAGDDPLPAERRRRDELAISLCELWTEKVSPQQRLRAMRIAVAREHAVGDKLAAHSFGDRVAWIVVEGEVTVDGEPLGPGAFIYPESLVTGTSPPHRDCIAVATTEVRAVAIRNDDFNELCEDDPELGEALQGSLATIMGARVAETDAVVREIERARTDPVATATPARREAETESDVGVAARRDRDAATATGAAPDHEDTGGIPIAPLEDTVSDSIDSAIEHALAVRARRLDSMSDAATGEPEIEVTETVLESARSELELDLLSSSAPELQIIPVAITDDASAPITLPRKHRPPTEPEIVMTIEADEPPEGDPSDDAAVVASAASSAESSGVQITVSHDDGTHKVISTVTESSDHTVTVTVEEPTRTKPVTAGDGPTISGTIESRLPRAKRGE